MKRVIGICRYSVLSAQKGSWRVGKEAEWAAYRSSVLNPDRLQERFELFRCITLPSIAGSSVALDASWFKFVVLVSDSMPAGFMADLQDEVSDYDWCEIVAVPERAQMTDWIDSAVRGFVELDELYGTFRIDDDDALSRNYLERLLPLLEAPYAGHVVTFPFGWHGLYDAAGRRFSRVAEAWSPKIALGLAYVSSARSAVKHVFQLGNHKLVDRRFPTVSLPGGPMYIRTIHDDNDSFFGMDESARSEGVEKHFKAPGDARLDRADEYFSLRLGPHGMSGAI